MLPFNEQVKRSSK